MDSVRDRKAVRVAVAVSRTSREAACSRVSASRSDRRNASPVNHLSKLGRSCPLAVIHVTVLMYQLYFTIGITSAATALSSGPLAAGGGAIALRGFPKTKELRHERHTNLKKGQ